MHSNTNLLSNDFKIGDLLNFPSYHRRYYAEVDTNFGSCPRKQHGHDRRSDYSVGFDHALVEICARFWNTLLSFIIHIDDTKTLRIAVAPFEIVQKRPGKIA